MAQADDGTVLCDGLRIRVPNPWPLAFSKDRTECSGVLAKIIRGCLGPNATLSKVEGGKGVYLQEPGVPGLSEVGKHTLLRILAKVRVLEATSPIFYDMVRMCFPACCGCISHGHTLDFVYKGSGCRRGGKVKWQVKWQGQGVRHRWARHAELNPDLLCLYTERAARGSGVCMVQLTGQHIAHVYMYVHVYKDTPGGAVWQLAREHAHMHIQALL